MTTEIAAAGTTGTVLVTGAVKRASASTGAGFDFLMKMAARESGFDPNAQAKTSSAAGLFQFIEQTWLSTVKQYGGDHGLGAAANAITQNANGRYEVADPAAREKILNLRFNAEAASAMAGELANENKTMLESRLGRAASSADLYTAHFLGPSGAVKLLSAASNVKAADLLPQAAAANRPVFYDGARAKSVGEVVASIAQSMMGEAAPDAGFAQAQPARSVSPVGNYMHQIVDAFSAPATKPASTGMSATALAVLDALDATLMREEGDEEESGLTS
ncbi:transglycosylase SLT domain-containing protein [Hyphococcus luteus]|uniref:Lytic transglycosylase n=1 Tax=Hyphococcus luteus TaxID=2058213 RepID=A0A2S7K957_9PROT|nr:transglycosylase SLT domain-containing protein [Marinicaulis flavus]PQA89032.1 lytic transglycosylase [Marinicaulis flavus]